jgi:hypothetical protein
MKMNHSIRQAAKITVSISACNCKLQRSILYSQSLHEMNGFVFIRQ